MVVSRAWLIVALASCTGNSNKQDPNVSNTASNASNSDSVARLKQQLETARQQTESYLSGDALPVRGEVVALVEADPRPWWESLTPEENFLLFEMSPKTAERAPVEVRANAYCAGVASINPEWWGPPSAPETEPAGRLAAIGKPVVKCLAPLFDSDRRIKYMDGENRIAAKNNNWTVGDLAAGLTARVLGEPYDAAAPADTRKTNRTALRSKL